MVFHSLVSYPEKSLSNSWVFYVDKGADSLIWGVLAKAYNLCTLKKEARESGVQNHKNQELGMWPVAQRLPHMPKATGRLLTQGWEAWGGMLSTLSPYACPQYHCLFQQWLRSSSNTRPPGAIGPMLWSTAWIYYKVPAQEWNYKFNKTFLLSFFLSWESNSVPQCGLEMAMVLRMTLNFWFSCLCLGCWEKGLQHHACSLWLWRQRRASCVLAEHPTNWAMSSAPSTQVLNHNTRTVFTDCRRQLHFYHLFSSCGTWCWTCVLLLRSNPDPFPATV